MIKLKYSVQGLMAVVLSVIFVTASFLPAHAQVKKDSTKKIVLAKLDKKEETNIAVKAANVIYPDLLSGNEEQSLEYIEKILYQQKSLSYTYVH